jgi:hypothetical protein
VAFEVGEAVFVYFGDTGQSADVLRVDVDGGSELAYVMREQLEALREGFVPFSESFEAFINVHRVSPV